VVSVKHDEPSTLRTLSIWPSTHRRSSGGVGRDQAQIEDKQFTNKAAQPRSTETTLGERLRGNSIAGNRALSALARLLGRSAARELISG
jgi:hypothetical protein